MNWKAEATEKLRRYDAMCQALYNLPEEIARLEAAACALRSAAAVAAPVKSSVNERENKLLDNIVCRQELEWSLQQAKSWVDTTERAMSVLSPQEKLILHRLYIYPESGSIARLCKELQVEQSSIYRKRDKALRTFTIALYGAAEA